MSSFLCFFYVFFWGGHQIHNACFHACRRLPLDENYNSRQPVTNISESEILCATTNETYFAMLHRPPGAVDGHGVFQQMRLYRQALKDEEVDALASKSKDPNSQKLLRTCTLPSNRDSPAFEDTFGNDWYAKM